MGRGQPHSRQGRAHQGQHQDVELWVSTELGVSAPQRKLQYKLLGGDKAGIEASMMSLLRRAARLLNGPGAGAGGAGGAGAGPGSGRPTKKPRRV